MKIALIAPCKEGQRWKRRRSRFVWPPSGLLILGSLAGDSHACRLFDEGVEDFNPASVEADLAAISILTANAPRGYEIADRLRARGIPVIIGGIHASALPEEAGKHADSVFIGEAECGFRDVLEDMSGGRGLKPLYNPGRFCDPADIPIPRRDLLKPKAYGIPSTIMATRGCPYNCSFCSTTKFMGNRYRQRPVGHVVEELKSIGNRWFIFLDDNLLAAKGYAHDLMSAIAPLGKRWVAQTSMNAARDTDLLKLASKAGCMGMLIGFESLSEENLGDVRKGVNTASKFADAVRAFHEAGIFVQGSFIFGFDGDPPDIFSRTLEFVNSAPLEGANYSVLTPLPGTDLFKRLESEGRIKEKDWSKFDKLNVCFKPKNISPGDLMDSVKLMYRRTYSLSSIIRRLPWFRRQTPMALLFNLGYRRAVRKGWD